MYMFKSADSVELLEFMHEKEAYVKKATAFFEKFFSDRAQNWHLYTRGVSSSFDS